MFNVVGPGAVPLHVAIRETGSTPLPLPEMIVRPLDSTGSSAGGSFRFRRAPWTSSSIQSRSTARASARPPASRRASGSKRSSPACATRERTIWRSKCRAGRIASGAPRAPGASAAWHGAHAAARRPDCAAPPPRATSRGERAAARGRARAAAPLQPRPLGALNDESRPLRRCRRGSTSSATTRGA